MKNENYVQKLENVIKQMLQPLKDVPFNMVIESLTGKKVLFFDFKSLDHINVIKLLEKATITAGRKINITGILRSRPNEVGNDIEPHVKNALNTLKLNADTPTGPSGSKKSTGYPDIIFWYNKKPYYLECKTYNIENVNTTQRSFYFSPSDNFKVIYDTVHFLISYEIYAAGEKGANHIYKCRSYKILSIEKLSLDIKYEFNSDNRRMYAGNEGTVLLAHGEIR